MSARHCETCTCVTNRPLADQLLQPFPGESEQQYSRRLRREYNRETRPRRRSARADDITDEDVAALLR